MIKLVNILLLIYIKFIGKYLGIKHIFRLQPILESNFKNVFKFVQVGANDGKSFDYLYDFVTGRSSVGLVMEPVEQYFKELKSNYNDFPNIKCINVAVHDTLSEVGIFKINPEFEHLYPDWVRGSASFNSSHLTNCLAKVDFEHLTEETVQAKNINKILEESFLPGSVDYLQIDTEGYDYKVLRQIDFSIFKPSIIRFEFVNLTDEEKDKSNKLLKIYNYYLFDEGNDKIAIDFNKVKLY
jgi:FkbM family methyltransferase